LFVGFYFKKEKLKYDYIADIVISWPPPSKKITTDSSATAPPPVPAAESMDVEMKG
jgi:hypothetical protein